MRLQSRDMDKCLEKWDTDVKQLSQELHTRRLRRNATCSVNRLPPEILCDIFAQYQDLQYELDGGYGYKSWAPAQVCHCWRQLALSRPQLWCRITVSAYTSRQCVEELLERSASLPITVYVCTGLEQERKYHRRDRADQEWVPILDRVLGEMSRIQNLQVRYSEKIVQHVVSALKVKTPRLHKLSLVSTGNNINYPTELVALPEAPLLSCLQLRIPGIDLAECNPLLTQTLKELTISQALVLRDDILQTALSGLPYLEVLRITVDPSEVDLDVLVERPISMPRLRTIELTGTVSQCALLLNSLSLPQCSRIIVNCTGSTSVVSAGDVNAECLGDALAAKCWIDDKTGGSSLVNAMSAQCTEDVFTLSGWSETNLNNLAKSSYRSESLIVIVPVCPWLLETLFHSLAILPKIRRLILSDFVKGRDYMRITQMNNVEELSIRHDDRLSSHILIGALETRVRQQAPPLLFPKLKAIYLYSVTFNDEWGPLEAIRWEHRYLHRVRREHDVPVQISLEALKNALAKRREHGLPVPSLVLINPISLIQRDLQMLNGLVQAISIDGKIVDISDNISVL